MDKNKTYQKFYAAVQKAYPERHTAQLRTKR